jgi:chemotaxis protein MotB
MAVDRPFIIKKSRGGHAHAHHGGAWKIAYADFVTAMMAFFLMLWLISMTTPEQKKGIADYFAPPNVSETTSGAGGILGGTAYDDMSAKMSGSNTEAKQLTAPDSEHKTGPMVAVKGGKEGDTGSNDAPTKSPPIDVESKFSQDYTSAAQSIRQAWEALPDITKVADNLVVEENKDGLNIKIMDAPGRPMFPEGSKYPYEPVRQAIAAIAPILQKLSGQVIIAGHTSSGSKYDNPRYGPWELSADRANTVRVILGEFGLSDDHVSAVEGRATSQPLFADDPYLAGNSRVEITLPYRAPPVPPDMAP